MPRVITATIQSENIPSLVNTFKKIFLMMGLYVKTYQSKSSNNYPAHYVRVSRNKYMPDNETVSIRIADHASVQDKSKFGWKKESLKVPH